jgi:hypothetical protein
MNGPGRAARRAAVGIGILFGSVSVASAWSSNSAYTVHNDTGGYLIDYVITMTRIEEKRQSVRFDGRCESACTIFLAASRTCITPRASFGFHLPQCSSPSNNRAAAKHLLNSYPAWVRVWLRAHGGLTRRLKVMPYDYASRYIKDCEHQAGPSVSAAVDG